MESQTFLDTGVLPLLAEQTLVSCDTVDSGCNGGNPINAWGQMNGWGGDEYNKDYPYTSGTTQVDGTCKGIKSKYIAPNTTPNSYSMIASAASDESAMAVQIQKSPMSVCVDAANLWQTYTGGLVTASDGCGTSIDHAVQAVGINTDTFNGQKKTYWIVRNSWTSSWVYDSLCAMRMKIAQIHRHNCTALNRANKVTSTWNMVKTTAVSHRRLRLYN